MALHSSRALRAASAVGSRPVTSRAESRAKPVSSETPARDERAGLSARGAERGRPMARSGELETALSTSAAFRRYAPYVAKIGLRILGRRDEIDDFVQDVFVQVHRHLGSLREPQALKGWLGKLAVHEATRRLRRKRLRAWLGLAAAYDYSDVADASASPEQRALLSRVFATLDALDAAERVAWSLRYLEGETMERVAELCGCSLSTAKRRVAGAERALEKLGVGRV
jgi:RNA polymerase sigma-70 factor (ECF subfamily)